MGFKEYEGKNIYVMLSSKRIYTGVVKEVNYIGKDSDDVDVYLFLIIDKYGKLISFSNKEIAVLDEQDINHKPKKRSER